MKCRREVLDLVALYFFCCALLTLFSLHRVWLLIDFARALKNRSAKLGGENLGLCEAHLKKNDFTKMKVAVQLPLYNEPAVAERLLDACAQLRWPREDFTVQVLDDSDDETTALIARRAQYWRKLGVQVEHVRRKKREGYKAGALGDGLALLDAEFICVFDADFMPQPDFLERLMPAFICGDGEVGMVQARWAHLNRTQSWLTRAQAAFLDAHFSVEHQARAAHGRFFNFNGTAGVWRKSTIVEAGGWDAATLTEDLDLSFRAQLGGARFVYLDDVEVLAELPACVHAFKSQQHRWAKGSIQTARRLLGEVWRAEISFLNKLDATLKLLQNTAFLFLALVMVALPVVALENAHGASTVMQILEWSTLLAATGPVALHFAVAQWVRRRGWLQVLTAIPLGIGLGGALSIHNARAVLEGLLGKGHDAFIRTPKAGSAKAILQNNVGDGEKKEMSLGGKKSELRLHPLSWLEFSLGILHLSTAFFLLAKGLWLTVPFLLLFGCTLLMLSTQPFFVGLFDKLELIYTQTRLSFSKTRRV